MSIILPNSKEKVYFSNKGLNNITHGNDFTKANYLPFIKEIIETGKVKNTDDENKKIVNNQIYFRGKIVNVKVTIKRDSGKEWYFNIENIDSIIKEKTDIISSQFNGSLHNRADNNIIPNSQNNLNPSVNKHEDEPLLQSDKTYFQAAYHGTPYRFDEFSTEYIGSGEGAQAHGWGLYFAEKKDVSET